MQTTATQGNSYINFHPKGTIPEALIPPDLCTGTWNSAGFLTYINPISTGLVTV